MSAKSGPGKPVGNKLSQPEKSVVEILMRVGHLCNPESSIFKTRALVINWPELGASHLVPHCFL